MNSEEEARAWVEQRVSRETIRRLETLSSVLRQENALQNLVSRRSVDCLWLRHIADSLQLIDHAGRAEPWIDLGTGAGFPGLVVAAVGRHPVTLVEARRLRADFLRRAAFTMGLEVEIIGDKAERLPRRPFGVISARAFAPLPRALELGTAFSTAKTIWLLPKGKNAASELEDLDPSWQGDFRLEPSLTDPEASIIVAQGVHRKANRKGR